MTEQANMCKTCEELNEEELGSVNISEIRINGAGYYNYHRQILYCPTCGKKLTGPRKTKKVSTDRKLDKYIRTLEILASQFEDLVSEAETIRNIDPCGDKDAVDAEENNRECMEALQLAIRSLKERTQK